MSLKKLQTMSCLYLAVLTLASAFAFSLNFALSVVVGGIISIISFWVSHTDVTGFVQTLINTSDSEQRKKKAKKGKGRYLLKFWIRIAIIGVVLALFITSGKANIFGLVLGLSTVVFTITTSALVAARHYFFSGRR